MEYTPSVDAYGQPIYTWTVIHADEPCRHVSGQGREIKVGQEVHVVYDQLFLEDIDITVWDRVVINEITYNVVDVVFRQDGDGGHHKQVYLERVQ